MKRKMKKFNEGGKTYNKEDEGLFGGKINYREEDGRKYVAGKATPFDRNPSEQRYYSVDDVKSKLSGLFGGKKEDSSSKYDDSKSVGDADKSSSYHKSEEGPRRQMTDSMTNKPKAADKTYLREEADIDYKPAKKVESKKTSPDAGFTKKDNRTTKDAGFTKKDNRTTKDEGFTKKERPKSVVFKSNVFEEEKEQDAPVVRKVVKETVAKESKKAADTTVPKAFDMKSGNKTIYGTTTTDVFKQNEERKRKAAADKAAEAEKKRRSRPSSEEMMSQSLGAGYKRGGSVRSASARADGCAIRGKTRA